MCLADVRKRVSPFLGVTFGDMERVDRPSLC